MHKNYFILLFLHISNLSITLICRYWLCFIQYMSHDPQFSLISQTSHITSIMISYNTCAFIIIHVMYKRDNKLAF